MPSDTHRKRAAQIQKAKASLEKDLSKKSGEVAKLVGQIGQLARQRERTSSRSTAASKQRSIEAKQKTLAQQQKKAADLEGKIAAKSSELARTLKKMSTAEGREQKQRETEAQKRQREETRHERALTREHEKRLRLQAKIISLEDLPDLITVLFLASNPTDQKQLRLDEEMRAIQQKVRASEYREAIRLTSRWAVRTGDLIQALNEATPHVVHFSGHGSTTDVAFMAPGGETKTVSKTALVELMNTAAEHIRLVVFNTCLSSAQAEAVTEHVDAAIGMDGKIGDEAARVFAGQLYSSIGFGMSVQAAFDQARAALMVESIPEEDTPSLYVRDGIDPAALVLVKPVDQQQPE